MISSNGTLEEILASIEPIKPRRGRPKKKVELRIVIDRERFNEERGRVKSYLDAIENGDNDAFTSIQMLEDLGVIISTRELPKDIVVKQLHEELEKPLKEGK